MVYVSIFVELCAVGVFPAVSRNEVEKRGRGGRVVNFLLNTSQLFAWFE